MKAIKVYWMFMGESLEETREYINNLRFFGINGQDNFVCGVSRNSGVYNIPRITAY